MYIIHDNSMKILSCWGVVRAWLVTVGCHNDIEFTRRTKLHIIKCSKGKEESEPHPPKHICTHSHTHNHPPTHTYCTRIYMDIHVHVIYRLIYMYSTWPVSSCMYKIYMNLQKVMQSHFSDCSHFEASFFTDTRCLGQRHGVASNLLPFATLSPGIASGIHLQTTQNSAHFLCHMAIGAWTKRGKCWLTKT